MKTLREFKKYNAYAKYAAKAELKAEVSNSYLTWIWWILDPLFYMLIYTFIVEIVFSNNIPNLPVFVMSGIIIWNFFNKCILTSVKIITTNRGIITQKYIPKYMLVIEKMYVNFIKFLISAILLIIMAIIFKIKITIEILYVIPLLILLLILSFGCSTILAHAGVFIDDMANITQIILRFMFYLSGIFYSIQDKLSGVFCNILLRANPIAYIIESFRNCFMYNKGIDLKLYFYWLIISILISIISIRIVRKYENSYAKVI